MSDAIIEAEMVAFSDTAGRIDGVSCRFLSRLFPVKLPYRILEDSQPYREHRSWSKAQSPQDTRDASDVSSSWETISS